MSKNSDSPAAEPAAKKTTEDGATSPDPNVGEVNRVKEVKPDTDTYDPFAPENMRLPQEYLDQVVAQSVLGGIEVQKPGDQEFIRVHPSADYRHLAVLIEHKEEKGLKYLVHPSYAPRLTTIKVHLETLYLYMNRAGKLAFWPIKVSKDGRENKWLTTATNAAEKAMLKWLRVSSDDAGGGYLTFAALGEFPEPQWAEKTQGRTIFQLLAIAFKERLIMDEHHPLIRKLHGL